MKKTLLILLTCLSLSVMGQNIIYVNVNVVGGANNGTSWANAYNDFATAMSSASSGKQVWVAKGTYKKTFSDSPFSMKEGVAIYGGFAGTETILEQRNYSANPTKLTRLGVVFNNALNELTATAVLDGFTITNGDSGHAGMINISVSPTIRNCIFAGNLGDGISNRASSPIIINCLFTGNSESGIYNKDNSSPTIINTTIAGNNGNAFFNDNSSTPVIYNSIVWGGTVGSYTAGHSLIKDKSDTNNGNINAVAYNENDIFSNYAGGDYKLKLGSPAINRGNNSLYAGLDAGTLDLSGRSRVYGYANSGVIDMGAYEYQVIQPDVNNVLYVNSAVTGGTGSGNSWANAVADLAAAISASVSGDQIWVAKGTYKPESQARFSMKEGVAIYGGFVGTETILEQRNYIANPTKLTGTTSVFRNILNELTAAATLDGFTITNQQPGSGMNNDSVSPTIRNCFFVGNLGDGMINKISSPIIINCVFAGNSYSGIYNEDNSSPTIINTTVAHNINVGSALFSSNSTPVLHNSIVWGGTVGSYTASHSLIKDKTDTNNGNISATLYSEADIFSNYAGGDYRLKLGSPAINVGRNSLYTGLAANTLDLSGSQRVYNYVNAGAIDIGAYEYQGLNIALDADHIIYVNNTVSGGNGLGNSWTNAVNNLADALKYAHLQSTNNNAIYATNPLKIYVAKGTYKPLYSPSSNNFGVDAGRDNTFLLVPNVAIYGGFTGNETSLTERNWKTNQTILSGDLDNDDILNNGISTTINGSNGYHVLLSGGDMGSAILDGFTVTGGSATGAGNLYVASGLNNYAQDFSRTDGAGIYNRDSGGSFPAPTIRNCQIAGNHAGNIGGGMANYNSSPIITNCIISNNIAATLAGGMRNSGNAATKITGSLIYGNVASSGAGAGISNTSSNRLTITNCTIAANGQGLNNGGQEVLLYNTIVWDDVSGSHTAQYSLLKDKDYSADGNVSANGLTASDIFTNYSGGDYTLKNDSPVVNKGSNALYVGLDAATLDLAGKPRLFEGTIDLGAYENQTATSLPVSFGKFAASLQNNRIKLAWNTFSETNNELFIVLRSTDGVNYSEIGQQLSKGDGANDYIAYDHHPVNGVNYYRLKQQDKDGTITALGDDAVNFSLGGEEVKAWPNPVKEKLNLSFPAGKYQVLKLLNVTGRKLQEHVLTKVQQKIILNMERYPKGGYIIELKGDNGNHLIKVLK